MDRAAHFVRARTRAWGELEKEIARVRSGGGLRPGGAVEFARSYRDVAADLSAARAMDCPREVLQRLNGLVSEAHGVVYRTRARASSEARRGAAARAFLALPRAFLDNPRTSLVGLSVFLCAAALSWLYVAGDERRVHEVFPSLESVISPQDGKAGQKLNVMPATLTSFYIVNNSYVAMAMIAAGLLFGLGTCWMLVVNGAAMGALAGHFSNQGALHRFWPQILPHGVTELLAMMAGAQAGLLLARAFWAPGEYSRVDALAREGRTAARLAFACIALMLWSGFVESYFTRSTGDDAIRNGFAAVAAVLVAAWFALAARAPRDDGAPEGARITAAAPPSA